MPCLCYRHRLEGGGATPGAQPWSCNSEDVACWRRDLGLPRAAPFAPRLVLDSVAARGGPSCLCGALGCWQAAGPWGARTQREPAPVGRHLLEAEPESPGAPFTCAGVPRPGTEAASTLRPGAERGAAARGSGSYLGCPQRVDSAGTRSVKRGRLDLGIPPPSKPRIAVKVLLRGTCLRR